MTVGNVLSNSSSFYLIDWERVNTRVAGFDFITVYFSTRPLYPGAVKNIYDQISSLSDSSSAFSFLSKCFIASRSTHLYGLYLFYLLEEIIFHVDELSSPQISYIPPYLTNYAEELLSFLRQPPLI